MISYNDRFAEKDTLNWAIRNHASISIRPLLGSIVIMNFKSEFNRGKKTNPCTTWISYVCNTHPQLDLV